MVKFHTDCYQNWNRSWRNLQFITYFCCLSPNSLLIYLLRRIFHISYSFCPQHSSLNIIFSKKLFINLINLHVYYLTKLVKLLIIILMNLEIFMSWIIKIEKVSDRKIIVAIYSLIFLGLLFNWICFSSSFFFLVLINSIFNSYQVFNLYFFDKKIAADQFLLSKTYFFKFVILKKVFFGIKIQL